MKVVYTDGGRAASGYKDYQRGDCGCRATAIVLDKPYKEIYKDMYHWFKVEVDGALCKGPSHPRKGIVLSDMKEYMDSWNWRYVKLPHTGRNYAVRMLAEDLPMGRLIVHVHRHFVAVIDHVMYDTWDCSDGGFTGVLGYFVAR